jgi:hypothetical protein
MATKNKAQQAADLIRGHVAGNANETVPSESAAQPATPAAKQANLCLNLFDAANPTRTIYLPNNVMVRVYVPKFDYGYSAPVLGDGKDGPQTIDLARLFEDLTKKETGFKQAYAELTLSDQQEVGCARYVASKVTFLLKKSDLCSCIPVPLQQVQQACRITFAAKDDDEKDFDENAKFFLNSVEWTVTAINAPVSAHGTKPVFQPFTASVRSVEGAAEITELPLHQLYRIDTRGPKGYTNVEPSVAVDFRYICCENRIEIDSLFSPCGSEPTRSVIFVQQACSGNRWGTEGKQVSLAGKPVQIDANGMILKVPTDLNDLVSISAPGYVFSPAMLDLRKGAQPVITVTVAEETAAASAMSRGLFVDESNVPFVNRPVTVLLPDGREIKTMTDDEGFFDAPEGSQVFAGQHDSGPATETVLVAPMLQIDVIEGNRRRRTKEQLEKK